MERLEAEEQRRLTPILAQLSSLQQRDTEATQALKVAKATCQAEEAQLEPLKQCYDTQWPRYESAWKKLAQLREYPPVVRFFVQLWTDVWEQPLEASIQDLAAPLRTLQGQMGPLQKRVAKATQDAEWAEKRHNTL
ncbi:hypothetical protein KDW_32050 [Dictyobacter vulcani]|uniref:Uncharacterized protein n=1 Tax=Dictyobacter vulcani TaxID=2607529 RepID=A0A5J4KMS3_9CHLR|nr:hypothetical protein [Dictyobacter vulcani]GER89043.1 hypothetical protein KDW_32050 [Dictyobacter vulcani]